MQPTEQPLRSGHVVRALLAGPGFRRLLAIRLSGQLADGIFQASLAGAVLFNPERAATPADIAAGFAVLLLPYSLVGPFAGVLLDRWSRRHVLVWANLVRVVLVVGVAGLLLAGIGGGRLYLGALVVLAVNRFVLSALSASLPHVAADRHLVTGNSMTTTLGTLASVLGAGLAVMLLRWFGERDLGYAGLALSSTVVYLGSAWLAKGFRPDALGPDTIAGHAESKTRDIVVGLVAGARHIVGHRPALAVLAVLTLHRVVYGVLSLATLLLYRNFFDPVGPLRVGIVGLGEVLIAGAAGATLAALITPVITRHLGKPRWVLIAVLIGAVSILALGPTFRLVLMLPLAFLIGLVGQAVKICSDTINQELLDDAYRGRAFSVSDTLYNLAFILGLLLGAVALPADGRSPVLLIAAGVAYLVVALGYGIAARRGAYGG